MGQAWMVGVVWRSRTFLWDIGSQLLQKWHISFTPAQKTPISLSLSISSFGERKDSQFSVVNASPDLMVIYFACMSARPAFRNARVYIFICNAAVWNASKYEFLLFRFISLSASERDALFLKRGAFKFCRRSIQISFTFIPHAHCLT